MSAELKIVAELLPGAFLLQAPRFDDRRGTFVKTFHEGQFQSLGLPVAIREEYYSISARAVIRGMHFQLPPHDHEKLVSCLAGSAQDVLLDLRKGAGYGKFASIELSDRDGQLLLIPRGVAHGFQALRDGTLMLYKTSTVHAPDHDRGIRWDSFGASWKLGSPVLSDRDLTHPWLQAFTTPF